MNAMSTGNTVLDRPAFPVFPVFLPAFAQTSLFEIIAHKTEKGKPTEKKYGTKWCATKNGRARPPHPSVSSPPLETASAFLYG